MRVSIADGNSPTLKYVQVGPLDFAFSYSTIVAFRYDGGWVVSENVWSQTTGKHLNEIQPDHKRRVKYEEFERRLNELLDDLTLISKDRSGMHGLV